MYCPLIDRFRGALLGCAIAERTAGVQPSLTEALVEQGQQIHHLRSCLEVDIDTTADVQVLARTILVSIMLHDSPSECHQVLQSQSSAFGIVSETIAARLRGQMPIFPPETALATTIESTIDQQLPLQDAIQVLITFPGLNSVDQAIAIALYCWRCTPHLFATSVGRSCQSLRHLAPINASLTLVPGITGLMAGLSVGSVVLFNPDHQTDDSIQTTATHLFQVWAGMGSGHFDPLKLEWAVIGQSGQLKPRTLGHLTLNSDYD